MFEKIELPKKINPSPIAEAIFEIRFSSDILESAFLGIYLPVIRKFFGDKEPEELPILTLPAFIRKSDSSLKYEPYYRISKDCYVMAFGPNSVSFSCVEPYKGWLEWSGFFCDVLKDIGSIDLMKNTIVNRLGLRYIDKFQGNIFDNINLICNIGQNSFTDKNTHIRTEFKEDDIGVVLQIANGIKLDSDKLGSIYDIDCILSHNENFVDFINNKKTKDILDNLHKTNKRFFFGMLKDNFLKSLKPEWEV